MSEYIPGSMTDEQALKVLKSAQFLMERGSSKTFFQSGLMEAMCHAIKALEEKVERESNSDWFNSERKGCSTCKYRDYPIPAEPCFSCIHGVCDENTNRTERWEASEND